MTSARPHPARRALLISIAGAILTLGAACISLMSGPVSLPLPDVLRALLSWTGLMEKDMSAMARDIVLLVRLPRTVLAALAGGALSVAGAVFQVLLRNVLAEPYILGVSSGAAVGALIAMSTGIAALFWGAIPLSAFLGASLVVVVVHILARARAQNDSNTLLLVGVMVGAFLSAIILALVSTVGDPVRNALFWLLGYLGHATPATISIVAPVVLLVCGILFVKSHTLNVLALGDEQASHLGLDARRVSLLLYLAASMLTASVVSFSGSIGFVGLIIPHLLRRTAGPDHRVLLPGAFFFGAAFLIISDIVARSVLSPVELPVGAVTAALGAPVFIWMLWKGDGLGSAKLD